IVDDEPAEVAPADTIADRQASATTQEVAAGETSPAAVRLQQITAAHDSERSAEWPHPGGTGYGFVRGLEVASREQLLAPVDDDDKVLDTDPFAVQDLGPFKNYRDLRVSVENALTG